MDIIAAIVAYLAEAMSAQLSAVYADYVPGQPAGSAYAVVHEGPETFTEAGAQDGSNGPIKEVIPTGTVFVEFIAPTKLQTRQLVRSCVGILIDSAITLEPADGPVLALWPVRAESVRMTDVGAGTPTEFKRVLTVGYTQEFFSPGQPGG